MAMDAVRRRLWTPVTMVPVALACLVPVIFTPTARVAITANDVMQEAGRAYLAPIDLQTYFFFNVPADENDAPVRSRLALYENGHPLGPPHSLHDTIREHGGGTYSHWGRHLYFSTSDGTDPRTNGRVYVAAAPTRLIAPVEALLVLLSISAFVALRRELRNRYGTRLSKIAGNWRAVSFSVPFVGSASGAIAVTLVAFTLACLAGLQYQTNDDVAMRLAAEGVLGADSRSQFLVFQNVVVGLALRELYGLAPSVPWYDIELASGAIVGAILCQAAAFRLCTSRGDLAFCAIAGLMFFTPLLQALQFTASAILLAGGGISMAASIWYRPPTRKAFLWGTGATIVAAFLSGSLIRFEAAFLVVVALSPILAAAGFDRLGRDLLFPALFGASAIAVALLAHAYETDYYRQSPEWENFWETKHQRGRASEHLHLDRTRSEDFRAALSAVQWTPNDYVLLSGWLFQNRELFGAERTKRFADLAPRQNIGTRIAATYRMLIRPESQIWFFAATCFAPLLLRRSFHAALSCVVTFGSVTIAIFVAGILYKPGLLHIVWPLYAVAALVNAAAIVSRARDNLRTDGWQLLEERCLATVLVLGLVSLTALKIGDLPAKAAAADELRRRVASDLAKWPAGQNDTVVVWDKNFPFEIWALPFSSIPSVPFRFLHTTAFSTSPLVEPIYAAWGTSDVAWSMCNMPHVYMVDAGLGLAKRHAEALTTYMQEHYRRSVEISSVFNGEALTLYVCRPAQASPR